MGHSLGSFGRNRMILGAFCSRKQRAQNEPKIVRFRPAVPPVHIPLPPQEQGIGISGTAEPFGTLFGALGRYCIVVSGRTICLEVSILQNILLCDQLAAPPPLYPP